MQTRQCRVFFFLFAQNKHADPSCTDLVALKSVRRSTGTRKSCIIPFLFDIFRHTVFQSKRSTRGTFFDDPVFCFWPKRSVGKYLIGTPSRAHSAHQRLSSPDVELPTY